MYKSKPRCCPWKISVYRGGRLTRLTDKIWLWPVGGQSRFLYKPGRSTHQQSKGKKAPVLHKRAIFVHWGVPVQHHGQWTSTGRGRKNKNKNKKTAFRHGPAPQQQPTKSAANATGAHQRRKRQQQRSQQERRCKQSRLREAAPAGASSSSRGRSSAGTHCPRVFRRGRRAYVFAALPTSCTTRARATALGQGAGDAAGLRSRRPPRVRPAVAPLRAALQADQSVYLVHCPIFCHDRSHSHYSYRPGVHQAAQPPVARSSSVALLK